MSNSVPEGAVFEVEIAGGVALYDVSNLLPKHAKLKYEKRDPAGIVRVYSHHSGALGRSGYAGLLASTKYGIRDTPKKKGWPGQPYTYWYAFEPDVDAEGRIVVYRCNLDATRSYHTGKDANGHGVGVAWQGNLTKQKPSDAQVEMAEAHFPWLHARHNLSQHKPFSFHAEAGEFGGKPKPTCPGPHVTAFVQEYRSKLTTIFFKDETPVIAGPLLVAEAPVKKAPNARG
jgi:hypothetical protein